MHVWVIRLSLNEDFCASAPAWDSAVRERARDLATVIGGVG